MVRILRASGTDFRALPEMEAINYREHLMPIYDRHAPSTGLLGRWLSHYLSCTLTSMGVPGSEATKAKQFAWDGEECIIGTENYTFTWFP